MEKYTPHYDLAVIKADVRRLGAKAFTRAAKKTAEALDLDLSEMQAVIFELQNRMLYKSMTTYVDHRIWHDQPSGDLLQRDEPMNTQHCFICGAPDAMTRFEGRSETMRIKGMERRIDDLSGWECQVCEDGMYDPDSCERHANAGDDLLHAARGIMGAELKRIRRKLHLTQKETVGLLSGGGHNAFSRYERGEITPPKPLMVLMRLLDRYPHLLIDAKELAEGADLRNAFTYTINDKTQEALNAS
eukprot:gene577-680_t